MQCFIVEQESNITVWAGLCLVQVHIILKSLPHIDMASCGIDTIVLCHVYLRVYVYMFVFMLLTVSFVHKCTCV